ncbi:hypothetical protein JCM8097_008077 [Rhodosporidiobolus ruineniae]
MSFKSASKKKAKKKPTPLTAERFRKLVKHQVRPELSIGYDNGGEGRSFDFDLKPVALSNGSFGWEASGNGTLPIYVPDDPADDKRSTSDVDSDTDPRWYNFKIRCEMIVQPRKRSSRKKSSSKDKKSKTTHVFTDSEGGADTDDDSDASPSSSSSSSSGEEEKSPAKKRKKEKGKKPGKAVRKRESGKSGKKEKKGTKAFLVDSSDEDSEME